MSLRMKEPLHDEIFYKQKIHELEQEVKHLKTRLEELRRAKHTTRVKREREVVQVEAPFRRNSPMKTSSELKGDAPQLAEQQRLHQENVQTIRTDFSQEKAAMVLKHENEISDLMKKLTEQAAKHQVDLENAKKTPTVCDHGHVIEALQKQVNDLESDNLALHLDRKHLGESVDKLRDELSVKEAKWCQTEQTISIQIQTSWQEKYKKWFEEMETKLRSLQEANAFLQSCVRRSRPEGSDPSHQDHP